jgi:hypothetical protein
MPRSAESADLLAIWEEAIAEAGDRGRAAYAAADDWRSGIRAAAWAYCRFFEEDPLRARFVVELSLGCERVRALRNLSLERLADVFHLGRLERERGTECTRLVAEAVVGASWEQLCGLVMREELDRLPSVVPELMYLAVLPYLGEAAAREELHRGPADLERYRRGEI